MAIPKLLEAACKGTHLPGPDDDGSDENFIYGGPENADGPAAARPEWRTPYQNLGITYRRPRSPLPRGAQVFECFRVKLAIHGRGEVNLPGQLRSTRSYYE